MARSSADRILVDTNVLVYAVNTAAPQHEAARHFLHRAISDGMVLCLTTQVLLEYVSIVTTKNILARPMSMEEASSDVEGLSQTYRMLQPDGQFLARTLTLMRQTGASGRAIFDMAIASTMLGSGVNRICTYNVNDFARIPVIDVVTP